MDIFCASYKDGTQGTRDFRWYSSMYLLLRVLLVVSYISLPETNIFVIAVVILLVATILTTTKEEDS